MLKCDNVSDVVVDLWYLKCPSGFQDIDGKTSARRHFLPLGTSKAAATSEMSIW